MANESTSMSPLTNGIDALLSRYSLGVKHLIEPGPNDAQLAKIAGLALRAPDHGELMPFRLSAIRGAGREKLADLFESYARAKGKSEESCAIERERALRAPVSIAIIARIDLHHPMVPAHEQWACIGGAVTNILNAAHLLGFAGKMLSGEKVRDPAISAAFCSQGETLVGWVSLGTPNKALSTNREKPVAAVLSYF